MRICKRAGAVPVILLLLFGAVQTRAQAPESVTPQRANEIVQGLRKFLPAGGTMNDPVGNRTPEQWHTHDPRGYEVTGQSRGARLRFWIVPQDWIGIRMPRANRSAYPHSITHGPDYKLIVDEGINMDEILRPSSLGFLSLVNGGSQMASRIFRGRINEVERATTQVTEEFCSDRPCRDEAAYSLVELGVPARAVILDCAANGSGTVQEFCVSALAHFDGPDIIQALERVIVDPRTAPGTVRAGAFSLVGRGTVGSGPALLTAFRRATSVETIQPLLQALGRIHYGPAAPEILARMEKEPPDSTGHQLLYASSLGSLRYAPAIPRIKELTRITEFSSDWILDQNSLSRDPAIALMRLTAGWGEPSAGLRLLLLPPASPSSPTASAQVAAVIENVGDRDSNVLGDFAFGTVIVDGTLYPTAAGTYDGRATLFVNDVNARSIHLPDIVFDGGSHRIAYQVGDAVSNTLTISFPRRRP